MLGIQSERPGSNRPPRPWQGRALPNELLSLNCKELKQECKNRILQLLAKFFIENFNKIICIQACIGYFLALQRLVYPCNAGHISGNNHLKQKQECKKHASKTRIQKKKPNCWLNLFLGYYLFVQTQNCFGVAKIGQQRLFTSSLWK